MKKLSIAALITASALFIGCGGGSSSDSSFEVLRSLSVVASDAYVVKLTSPAVAVCGDQNYTTTEVNDGNVTFNIPDNVDPNNCTFIIPDDAFVDTDGDGTYSTGDLTIRMGLAIQGTGVANPLSTAAVVMQDSDVLSQVKDFDPVKYKEMLIADPTNTQNQALVALSDAIADLVQIAKEQNIDPQSVLPNININNIMQQIQSGDVNASELLQNTLQTALANTPLEPYTDEVLLKAQNTLNMIEQLHNYVHDGDIDEHTALNLVIAHCDGDANVTIEENMTREDFENLLTNVKEELETKHNECLDDLTAEHDDDDLYITDIDDDHETDTQTADTTDTDDVDN